MQAMLKCPFRRDTQNDWPAHESYNESIRHAKVRAFGVASGGQAGQKTYEAVWSTPAR